MIQDTTCLNHLHKLGLDLISHGHGEIIMRVEGLKGGDKNKVQIIYGRSYVFFVKKEYSNIL